MEFPKIKKSVKAFLLSEEGRISKQSMLKMGAFLAAIGGAIVSEGRVVDAAHVNIDCCRSKDCPESTLGHDDCDLYVNAEPSHAHNIELNAEGEGVVTGTHSHAATKHCNGADHHDVGIFNT